MAGEWREVPLSEVYEFRSGLSKPRSAFGSGYTFLTFKDVFYNTFTPEILGDLVTSTERERELCSVRRGDVFLTRTSETQDELGMSCVALRDYDSATFNGFCKRLRPKLSDSVLPEYAGYYFRSPLFRRAVTAMSSMSTRASLNEAMLERLTILLPDVRTQAAIATVLKALDDKIELNRGMNATLEAVARALFTSWFIDFDPVRAKAAGRTPSGIDAETAKLFPDALVESGLGLIPKGWRTGRLDDLLVLQRGFDLPSHSRAAGPYPVVAASGPTDGHSEARVRGPGVVTGRSGVLGRVFLVLEDFWPLNTALWVKEFRACGPYFAYFALQQIDFSSFNAGSAVPTLNRNHVHGLPWLLPDAKLAATFEESSAPVFTSRDALNAESTTLARLRDELLPRLLSGALDVGSLADPEGGS